MTGDDALLAVARRVVWFEPPEEALARPERFIAYAMRYATLADMAIVRRHFGDDRLRESLDRLPPGIVDDRSWSYWNAIFGRFPPPPQPVRQLP